MTDPPDRMIAALYVQRDGVYAGLGDVDVWDQARDARRYDGPWPVVAHPPCARWCRFWGRGGGVLGADGGCFAAALADVRRWGGVLEHPAGSHAWRRFALAPPLAEGWHAADLAGGWCCLVEQGHYGHRVRKPTWLYAHGVALPSLRWGPSAQRPDLAGLSDEARRRAVRAGLQSRLSHRQRAATPLPFRDLLLAIARTAVPAAGRGAA